MSYCKELHDRVQSLVSSCYVLDERDTLKYLTMAYLCRGHVLIEGPPGTGKTLISKLMAKVFGADFKRVQLTSDMLPSDIIGSHVYSQKTGDINFVEGPIFCDYLLADEVNRTPPRTQSALLEAMEERQVTVEGSKHRLSDRFFVIATQNPRDFEGTFPLPESQLDRFLIKLKVAPASQASEVEILRRIIDRRLPPEIDKVESVDIDWGRIDEELNAVEVGDKILQYTAELVTATRNHPAVAWGSSSRASISLLRAARLLAAMQGMSFVTPDHCKELAVPVLRHRLRLQPDALVTGQSEETVIDDILERVGFAV